MALLIVLFAWSWISPTDSIPPTVTEGESSLSQRVNRLEELVIQQDLVIQQLERDKQQWEKVKELWEARFTELRADCQKEQQLMIQQDTAIQQLEKEKQQYGELRAEWQKAEHKWKFEKEALKDDTALLKDKLETLGKGGVNTVNISVHEVMSRSDDTNPLEPMVNQMVQRVTEMSAELQVLRNSVQEAASSVYVRWGNSLCPNSSNLVYTGVVGGSERNQGGAAANHLCLSLEPVASDHAFTSVYARLYGSEYYDTGASSHAKDPVCAVCRPHRSTVIMIPGTNKCQSGWTVEYSGFLMAGYYDSPAATEYICVDDHFGSRLGSDAQQFGILLMYTVTVCGSLPCGPYINNKVVTCAVCSK